MVRFLVFQENLGGAFENISKSSRKRPLQPIVLLVFLLVSRGQTLTANSRFPNEGIEQMARKNDGAGANPNTSTARAPVIGLRA
jgi:hypothetical protein